MAIGREGGAVVLRESGLAWDRGVRVRLLLAGSFLKGMI
jgi:hypothetical protein